MQSRNILIVQGHPDASKRHLGHALADAYAAGAEAGGHTARRIDIAHLAVRPLTTEEEFQHGKPPPEIAAAQEAIHWAEHIVLVFPLWLGTVPALVKAFLEQVMRPDFAFAYTPNGMAKKLLGGRSARLIVTMGMPALLYRWYFLAHGVRGIERNILSFVGFDPVHTTFLGGVATASLATRTGWITKMTELGYKSE